MEVGGCERARMRVPTVRGGVCVGGGGIAVAITSLS